MTGISSGSGVPNIGWRSTGGGGGSTTIYSVGAGVSLVVSPDKVKSIIGGTNCSIVDNGNDVTINILADDITVVANYSALPAPATVTGEFYWCSSSQGTAWLPFSLGGTYYSAGLYYSNGIAWEFLAVPYQATLATVNTGTNNDQFVTSYTLTNANVIVNKELLANKDASGGYVGLTLFKINFKNVANTFTSFFTNSNSASRTYTFPDKDITVAGIDDIQSGEKISATASGTDTYTASISPAISAYANTQKFYILFTNANSGACTINLNGLGAKAIKKGVSTALVSGDILAGQVLCLAYDGTNFQVVGGGSVTYGTTANTATQGNDTRVTNDEICISFDGQGSVIAVNTNAINPATSGGATITGWYIEGDVSGSITIDIKKNGTSMTGAGGNKPLLASAVTNNASVSGWTSTTYVVNDKLEVYVSVGAVSLTKCWLVLKTTITS